MPTLYILSTPEFEPIVDTARAAGMDVRSVGDYLEATTTRSEVTLSHAHTGVRPSIWFAALTGGLDGRIVRFDHDELCLADAD
jgi:hypothetical protein